MGWVIFFAGLIAWVWGAWALVVIAMIAGLVIVEVQP